jgi:hypothetical protein
VTGLSDTVNYYFIVQSYDSTGMRSAPSDEVMYASFSMTCQATTAASPDGNPVAVTLNPPIIVGGVPHPDTADCVPASGSLFPVGETHVSCTASDATRTVSCETVVTVSHDSSETFTVTGSPGNVGPGGSLVVQWTAPPQTPPVDWIGLYRVDSDNGEYLWWRYTNGAPTGSFNLSAPETPGQYQFRYLRNDGYDDAARSNTIVVNGSTDVLTASPATVRTGQRVTVHWTAVGGTASDWIGLFPVDGSSTDYIWWTYTSGAASGSVTMTVRGRPGSYEFRYFPSDGFTSVARSNTVTITQ